MATMEEALVPIYMYHRYAVEAAASAVGRAGLHLCIPGRRSDADTMGERRRSARRDCGAGVDAQAIRADACRRPHWRRSRRGRRAGRCTANCSPAIPVIRFDPDQSRIDCCGCHHRLHAAARSCRANGRAARARRLAARTQRGHRGAAHSDLRRASRRPHTKRKSGARRRARSSNG